MDVLHRILVGIVDSPWQLRVAGFIVLEWFVMDHVWFIGTVAGWW